MQPHISERAGMAGLGSADGQQRNEPVRLGGPHAQRGQPHGHGDDPRTHVVELDPDQPA